MSNSSSQTYFTNDSGAAGGPTAYVQDAFPDVTDTPSNNSGWSSTVSSNPLNNLYGNDDFPRYGPKTLWVKDLVLEPNRGLWVNGEPTYRIIWSEPFPSAAGYCFGNVRLRRNANQTYVSCGTAGDGFGVGGVFARCMFIVEGNNAAVGAASGAVAIDGLVNNVTVDVSNASISAQANPNTDPMFAAFVAETTNEAYNIHDFRLTANQAANVLNILGVVIYSENSSLSIDQFPGTTYNNKTQAKTSANTTLALPSLGNSMGGRSVIWKNASGGYSMSTIGVSTVTSIASGTVATNILNLTAGTGALYSSNQGVVVSSGATAYVGVIQSISTDALTVFPTLPFGVSQAIYRYFQGGQSLSLNASLNVLAYTFGSTEMTKPGFTTTYLDPLQRFSVWGVGYGASMMDGQNQAVCFNGGVSGILQCEGYFSAAEVEFFGVSVAVLSGTFCVNGLPCGNFNNVGATGSIKRSIFAEAPVGWNSFSFFPGSSHNAVGIARINMYTRNRDISASYGILAAFDTVGAYAPRQQNATLTPANATCVAPGVFQRFFADQFLLKGSAGASWTRVLGATYPGGVAYAAGLSAGLSFQYYGSQCAFLTGSSLGYGASINLSIDTGSNLGATALNQIIGGSSLGFHSVSLTILGGTLLLSGVDIFRVTGEMRNLQTFSQSTLTNPPPAITRRPPTIQQFTSGSGTYFTPTGVAYLRVRMVGGGGGGGGSSDQTSDGGTGTPGNDTTFGNSTAGHGGGAAGRSPGGKGVPVLGSMVGIAATGSAGQGGMGNLAGTITARFSGGTGGPSAFAGSGAGGDPGGAGVSAGTNTGGGGGGGGAYNVSPGGISGGGGGSGAFLDGIISNPAASYAYSVSGAVGTGGIAGTNGSAGGSGAAGLIILEEYYSP